MTIGPAASSLPLADVMAAVQVPAAEVLLVHPMSAALARGRASRIGLLASGGNRLT